eukprot:scaffold3611_cov131-Isochrysis_galbana.AAC.2
MEPALRRHRRRLRVPHSPSSASRYPASSTLLTRRTCSAQPQSAKATRRAPATSGWRARGQMPAGERVCSSVRLVATKRRQKSSPCMQAGGGLHAALLAARSIHPTALLRASVRAHERPAACTVEQPPSGPLVRASV